MKTATFCSSTSGGTCSSDHITVPTSLSLPPGLEGERNENNDGPPRYQTSDGWRTRGRTRCPWECFPFVLDETLRGPVGSDGGDGGGGDGGHVCVLNSSFWVWMDSELLNTVFFSRSVLVGPLLWCSQAGN